MKYYKATRLDGTDFRTGKVLYKVGTTVTHPNPDITAEADQYLSVSTVATDCVGMEWPCRLFEVEPVGSTCKDESFENKVRCEAVKVIREIDAHVALGPQGEHVTAFINRLGRLTEGEADQLDAARTAAWDAVWTASRTAAWIVARSVVEERADNAVSGLIARDLISTEDYDILTRPWRTIIGPIHPDDKELT